MSLDSVDEIRTTRVCSLLTPDARDTIHLRIALWSSPPAPVVRGRRPAVRASKSRNTLARCGPWQKVIRFPEPQRSQGAGSPKKWQPVTPAMAAGMTDAVWTMEALLRYRGPCTCTLRLNTTGSPIDYHRSKKA